MSMPGFNGEASLYQSSGTYRGAGGSDRSEGTIQPAALTFPKNSCWAICGGDPDCVQCCLCVRHGGHPSHCCF